MAMAEKPETVWYFAYGSNMSTKKFSGSRGIFPIQTARVLIPNWVLSMEIPGLPYAEPSYGSIRPRDPSDAEAAVPDVHGIAYEITVQQYFRLIASEGGQIAYKDVMINSKPVHRDDEQKTGPELVVRTLSSSSMVRHPTPSPSHRYMNLLLEGAIDAKLPLFYRQYLVDMPCFVPPNTPWTKLGSYIFLMICNPVWSLLGKYTHDSTGKDGKVRWYVVWLVRSAVFLVWLLHDCIFAPIFGRGDGRKPAGKLSEPNEKTPLCN